MKNSLTRKLLLAVITLGIAVIATVGSTYAWFSMNTTVEATGMQLTATTPVNVVISKNGTDFTNAVEFTTDYENLYPASTATSLISSSGFTFFRVKEGQVIGSNGEGGLATPGSNGTKFEAGFTTESVSTHRYLIAEDLYFKTTAGKVSLTLSEIKLDSTDILVNSSAVSSSANEGANKIADALYIALVTDQGKVLFYSVNADNDTVYGVESVDSDGTYTVEASARTLSSSGTLVFDSATDGFELGTESQHVTVLVWLEGEDPDCVNAIGGLGLSIGLEFGYVEDSFKAQ